MSDILIPVSLSRRASEDTHPVAVGGRVEWTEPMPDRRIEDEVSGGKGGLLEGSNVITLNDSS